MAKNDSGVGAGRQLIRLLTAHPLLRYLFSGGTTFASEYLTFLLLFSVLHLQVYVANSISFCVGVTMSFTLNRLWAFKQKKFKMRRHHQMMAVFLVGLFNLFATNVIIGFLKHHGLTPILGKVLAMVLVVLWNFLLFNFVIFAGHKDEGEDAGLLP
ncbi:MAG TPA: GtrA family protein [Candidatus Saccharimonadales bacterium]|nr:GtrA family protein [Candidatus Saccharimonadales bacterium]